MSSSTDSFSFTETPWDSTPSKNLFGKIYYPIVVTTGLVGNVLNLIILSKRNLTTFSSSIYLIGLACADILVLVFQTTLKYVVYKSWVVTGSRDFMTFFCVYNNWILIGAVRTSFWITVGFTIERYIAISHPLWGKTWCTVSRAKKSLVVIYACGFTYGLYNLFVRYIDEDGGCKFKNDGLASAMGSLNASCFIVTYSLLVIFNGLIVYEFTRQTKKMKGHVATTIIRQTTNNQGRTTKNKSSSRISSQIHVTITLMTVSCVFMLLWFPWLLVYLNEKLPSNVQGLPSNDILHTCAEIMGPLNSAINFFLYNVTSRRFRRECLLLLLPCRHQPSSSSNHSESTLNSGRLESELNSKEPQHVQFLTPDSVQIIGVYRSRVEP